VIISHPISPRSFPALRVGQKHDRAAVTPDGSVITAACRHGMLVDDDLSFAWSPQVLAATCPLRLPPFRLAPAQMPAYQRALEVIFRAAGRGGDFSTHGRRRCCTPLPRTLLEAYRHGRA
jgi:hypothetical protein